jgi:hypothetical protein
MSNFMTPYELDYRWRDFWGEYLPVANEEIRAILESECYRPKWYHCPQTSVDTLTAAGYSQTTLTITPGSWIIAMQHDAQVIDTPFLVQITDLSLKHKWFSDPIPNTYLQKNEGVGNMLHKPYPVTAPGLFQIEFWTSVAQRCSMTFGVAEAIPNGKQ